MLNAKEFLALLELDGYVHRVFCEKVTNEVEFVHLLLRKASSVPETQEWAKKTKELEVAVKKYYF